MTSSVKTSTILWSGFGLHLKQSNTSEIITYLGINDQLKKMINDQLATWSTTLCPLTLSCLLILDTEAQCWAIATQLLSLKSHNKSSFSCGDIYDCRVHFSDSLSSFPFSKCESLSHRIQERCWWDHLSFGGTANMAAQCRVYQIIITYYHFN